jgi:archaea-specific DNA-binding protein
MSEKKSETTEPETDKKEKSKGEDNVIFVGNKPLVNYVRGVIVQFKRFEAKEVVIRSRGKFISKAVDVAEIAKRSLIDINIKVKDISISSEAFEIEGRKTNISTMDIVLTK